MTSLAELQAAVQSSILKGDKKSLRHVNQPPRGGTQEAFGVYQDAHDMRHREFLANDFEILKLYLGDTEFAALSQAYCAAHPSRHANARWYGAQLPEFLARQQKYRAHAVLAEIAALERAINDVFDGADAKILTIADLAEVDPVFFSNLNFVIHPAVRRLSNRHNSSSIWAALKCEEEPPGPALLETPQQLLIYRQSLESRFRILGDEEAMAFDSAREGVTFGVICEMIAAMGDADTAVIRAANYLRSWFEAEAISELR